MMNYVIWKAKDEGNSCVLNKIQGLEDAYELKEGISRQGDFSQGVFFQMDPEYPKNIKLSDCLINLSNVPLVSKRLKEFLMARKLKNVEYLPVTIINHKGRVASDEYFVVNPLNHPDCLNIDESECTWSHIIPTDIIGVKKLVIDENRIDPELSIIGIKYFYNPVLVKRELADAISREGFTGIRWVELEKFRR